MFIFLACVFFLADSLTDKSQLVDNGEKKRKREMQEKNKSKKKDFNF